MAKRFKRNDEVIVIAGKSKGIIGKISAIKGDMLIIENTLKGLKHFKRTNNEAGKTEQFIRPIHVSNISHCKDGSRVKVGFKYNNDGAKVLYIKKSGEEIRLT